MIVIYGHRAYGQVETHDDGEYAQTSFAHIYYMPLFPTRSMWITKPGPAAMGFPIKVHGKSVGLTYLRMWGPVAALGCLAAGGFVMIGGAAFAALTGWAWHTRKARPSRTSDFNRAAFGTRCDPSRMPASLRAQLKAALDRRWAALGLGKPPEDSAQYGASSLDEAATAYGLLRLAAIERGDKAAEAAAARLCAGEYEKALGDGPYRQEA